MSPAQAQPPGVPQGQVQAQDHSLLLPDGVRLFARSWTPAGSDRDGAPAPLLLFHDSLGSVALWRDWPAQLAVATGRRVLAYDRWGFGASDPRVPLPGVGFVAGEAQAVLPALRDQLGFSRFVALGHSVGGGMALHAAMDFAGDCEAVVTLASQVFAEATTLQGIREAREAFRDPAQFERLARYHGPRTRWVLDAWIDTWLHPDFARWSMVEQLPRVRAPVLVLHGDSDPYGATVHAQLIVAHCGGPVQLEILAQTGHFPHRERSEDVLARIARFLA